ncbi:MAG: TonB-dependent receptor, partial [Fulvivirga sp.]|nr:TonB-dependent receptor [Fulvivirga sp.]
IAWQNTSHVIRWNSTITDRLSMSLAAKRNDYVSHLIEEEPFAGFDLETSIAHTELDLVFDYKINEFQQIRAGISTKFLELDLGTLVPAEDSSIKPENIEPENGIESGVFFQHDVDFTESFGITYGLRYSDFRNMGPATVNVYEPGQTRSIASIVDTQEFGEGEITSYNGWEPRVAFNYRINSSTSLKVGYNRLYQYIQLISNTTAIAPTDTWKLSDTFIKPQEVSQYSLGFFKNFLGNRIETSIEGYYKDFDHVIDYKDGADLFLNPNLETDIISGIGRAYGLEFYLNKKYGRLKGWVSYTYSRTERKFDNQFPEETVNDGNFYPSNFDVPHNFTMVPIYRLGRFTTLSAVFTYATGRPFTIPLGKFEYDGVDLGFFDNRNNERAPDVHRLDVSLKFKLESRHKLLSGFWNLTIYNIYGRRNAFSVFSQDFIGSSPQLWKLSIIGAPFPTLSYEIKF